jgi:hypothetical protein
MILVGYGGIWWDLVGSGGIWWDLVLGSFDAARSRKLVGSVVESFDSTNFLKSPRGIMAVGFCGINDILLWSNAATDRNTSMARLVGC